jgi:hypothetical protein
MRLQQKRRCPSGLLEPDAWKTGTSGSEGAPAQQCAGTTRRFRIQRQQKRGSHKAFVYTWPSRKSLSSIMAKVKAITKQGTNNPLSDLLRQINGVLRGWINY